jgi:localization factor PodJL
MRNLLLITLLIFTALFFSGCVSSIKSTMDRSTGDAEFYTRKNYTEAVKAYRSAANNGDAESSYMLSRLLLNSKYGVQNVGEGLNRLNDAAATGHVLANRDLGIIYMSGKHGVEKSITRALPYYERAAGQNDEVSVLALAMIYGSGMGVKKNPVQAARWFAKAQELGLPIPAEMSHPDTIASLRPLPDGKKRVSAASADSKSLVREAQSLLTKLGYNPGPADGLAGKKTRQAVMSFQKKQKLPATGEINDQLVRDLEQALSNN